MVPKTCIAHERTIALLDVFVDVAGDFSIPIDGRALDGASVVMTITVFFDRVAPNYLCQAAFGVPLVGALPVFRNAACRVICQGFRAMMRKSIGTCPVLTPFLAGKQNIPSLGISCLRASRMHVHIVSPCLR